MGERIGGAGGWGILRKIHGPKDSENTPCLSPTFCLLRFLYFIRPFLEFSPRDVEMNSLIDNANDSDKCETSGESKSITRYVSLS